MLTKETREGLKAFAANKAELNGLSTDHVFEGGTINVKPDVERNWQSSVADASWFLKRITTSSSDSPIVENLTFSGADMLSTRTDTRNGKERSPLEYGKVSGVEFRCVKTNFDVGIPYDDLNHWNARNRAQFLLTINKHLAALKANNVVMIGWHGEKAEKDTNPVDNPLGQDVNIGWIQQVKDNRADKVIETAITIGEGGDYNSLDAFAVAAKAQFPLHLREGLVCLASEELVDIRTMSLIDRSTTSEIEKTSAANAVALLANKMEVLTPPYFPENTIIITPLKNLVWNMQRGATRESFEQNDRGDRYESFHQAAECYGIGDFDRILVYTNVTAAGEE